MIFGVPLPLPLPSLLLFLILMSAFTLSPTKATSTRQLVQYPAPPPSQQPQPPQPPRPDIHTITTKNSIEYDYSMSTEDNHGGIFGPDCPPIVGKYNFLRKLLDYSYHKYYSIERQQLHDSLIDQYGHTVIFDTSKEIICDKPADGNWIVFTAGAFGSGKSHVLTWLDHHGYFPLHSFVVVDPDHLREKLPETAEYIRRDASTAGYMTQKEVGYISEVIILKALLEGKNVIVDGSLKDHEWYCQYMLQLRNTFPQLKLAIIHVATSLETAVSRAARRGHETGRVVPVEAIKDQLVSIPQSLELLKSYVTYYCTFRNDDIPKLVISSTGEATLSSFKAVWEMSCQDNDNTDVCPDNLITWKKNNYYRLWVSTPKEYCKLNCSL